MSVPLVYHEDYVCPLPDGHRFPMKKFGLLFELLNKSGLINGNLYNAVKMPTEKLIAVHDPVFVNDFQTGKIGKKELRRIGLPWSDALVNRTLTALGGSFTTAKLAIKYGIACNLAGGTHHAFKSYGSGFCIFNDLAVVPLLLLNEKLVSRVLIIDLDVHQGDGTASMLNGIEGTFTLSVHCANNFPFNKEKSDMDVSLKDGVEDPEYLHTIREIIPGIIEDFKPELIIYDAGVDPYSDDPLGRLSLSLDGLFQRDIFVIEEGVKRGIPVSCVIGGGYSKNLEELAYRHSLVQRAAMKVFKERRL